MYPIGTVRRNALRWGGALLGTLFTVLQAGAATPDFAREARLAEEITPMLIDGEPLRLAADGRTFLAILTDARRPPALGAVILLHGMGVHPDWPDVIQPLRTRLPEHGITTLSIQLPVLASDARYEDYAGVIDATFPRIEAARAELAQRGIGNVALIGHSLGAVMGAIWLGERPEAQAVNGFVAVGWAENARAFAALPKIRASVLDLYGDHDLPGVLKAAPARAAAARQQQGLRFTQVSVPGADHFFNGLDDGLVARVRGWLATTWRATPVPEPPPTAKP